MQNRKSPYCTSAMGRMPVIAAPMATPAIPASEIGVSRMRSCPNSSGRPSVTVNAPPKPPGTPISSPRQKTVGSRRISSRIPSRSASAIVIVGMSGKTLPENVKERILGPGRRACLGEGDRLVDELSDFALDALQFVLGRAAGLFQLARQTYERVPFTPLCLLLTR